jgi:hypothetical protein
VQQLPARGSYTAATRVAELISSPYKDYAKYILKVSYNIGAETTLMLFGLTKGQPLPPVREQLNWIPSPGDSIFPPAVAFRRRQRGAGTPPRLARP